MPLISCSECGRQISDRAKSCPQCGNPDVHPPRPSVPSDPTYRRIRNRGKTESHNALFTGVAVAGFAFVLLLIGFAGHLDFGGLTRSEYYDIGYQQGYLDGTTPSDYNFSLSPSDFIEMNRLSGSEADDYEQGYYDGYAKAEGR